MSKELTYAGLKEMNKAGYLKLFKKPVFWKKATGVIFIAKHPFSNGKMPLVAIPFRKFTEATKVFKEEVKPNQETKNMLLATLDYGKAADGNITVTITPKKGGIGTEYLQTTGKDLFSNLKIAFAVTGGDGSTADTGKGTQGEDDANAALVAERMAKIDKINKKVTKLEKQIGKMKAKDITKTLLEDQAELEAYKAEAKKDGKVNAEEKEMITLLSKRIEALKDKLQNLLTPEQKQKAIDKVKIMTANVSKMLGQVNKAIEKLSS